MKTAGVFFILVSVLRAGMDWRQSLQPLIRKDTVPHAIRAARGNDFILLYGPLPKGWGTGGPDPAPIFQEIPVAYVPLMNVVLVPFASYKTIRSASGKSIYTEVRMNVEQVSHDSSGILPK